MTEKPYDLEIPGVASLEYAVLMAAVAALSEDTNDPIVRSASDSILLKIMLSNPEETREEFRGTPAPGGQSPLEDEILEKLGLVVENGEVVDAMDDDSVSIDVD